MTYSDPQTDLCKNILSGPAFVSCQNLIDTNPFINACVKDMCYCNSSTSCLCSTISEYSRQCAHAGGNPQQWKTAQLCGKNSNLYLYIFKLWLIYTVYVRITVSQLYFFFWGVEQQKHALSTWSIKNVVVPVQTPAATLREAKCVTITA